MIELRNLTKTYRASDLTVEALKNVNITIPDGDIFGIIGMSGAGKSTLVRCINMLERPSSGSVYIDGRDLCQMSERELRDLRRSVTMIFQGFNLLMQRTCLRNICFPLELSGMKRNEAKARALELLEIVGLKDKANAYPAQLSGGQQQRIAIARALATQPKVLLCDEATSALDPTTTHSILSLIREINRKLGITVVIITHQMSVVEDICRHVAVLDNGSVVEQGEVGAVFTDPKTTAAKRLVFPQGEPGIAMAGGEGEPVIRLVFNGAAATGKPMVAQMAIDTGVMANILYASTRNIDGKIYGSMLLSLLNGQEQETAADYLSGAADVTVEEVNGHV